MLFLLYKKMKENRVQRSCGVLAYGRSPLSYDKGQNHAVGILTANGKRIADMKKSE